MYQKRYWALLALLACLGLFALVLANPAQAADFRGGDNAVVEADEVIDDDLFMAGNLVEMNGTVTGDLWATGSEVIVNGQVEGSVFIAGQTLAINGPVGGSIYSAGYALTVGSETAIDRNVYYSGFSLSTEPGSTVGRSLYSSDYQTVIDGSVADDVVVNAGALEVNGSVGGDVRGEVASAEGSAPPQSMFFFPGAVPIIDPGLRVASGAEVGGQVDVVETTVDVDVSPPDARSLLIGGLRRTITDRIGEFIALLIVGGLLLRLWPAAVELSQKSASEKPLASAGSGCLLLIIFAVGVPLACAVTGGLAALGGLITFGQLSGAILGLSWSAIGFIVAAFSFVASLVAKVIVSFWAGRWILDRLAPERQPGYWTDFASLALGAFIYEILRAIPVVGWIIAAIVTLVGLGAAYFMLRDTFRPPPPSETPKVPEPEPA